jgi:hypothetical protein
MLKGAAFNDRIAGRLLVTNPLIAFDLARIPGALRLKQVPPCCLVFVDDAVGTI